MHLITSAANTSTYSCTVTWFNINNIQLRPPVHWMNYGFGQLSALTDFPRTRPQSSQGCKRVEIQTFGFSQSIKMKYCGFGVLQTFMTISWRFVVTVFALKFLHRLNKQDIGCQLVSFRGAPGGFYFVYTEPGCSCFPALYLVSMLSWANLQLAVASYPTYRHESGISHLTKESK